jgi:xanthine dehydrogenase accessory factor
VNLKETSEVLAAAARWRAEGRRMALATIVHIRGSTYRRPGARLLVPEEGDSVGNLSGGCLEGGVEEVARSVMRTGEPRLELYDLTADDEVVWGWGLGCNGAIEVFVEPADRAAEVADAIADGIEQERAVAIATVLESGVAGVEPGARLLVEPSGERAGSSGDDTLDDALVAGLDSLRRGGAEVRSFATGGGEVRAFLEVLAPPPRLVVCGAGHDAQPVVGLASEIGWRAVVVDDRPVFLTRDRFPAARSFVRCRPEEVAERVPLDDRTYVVVMSHNYLRDKDYLRALLGSPVAYVGMLGPRARTERLLDELAGEGAAVEPRDRERIHGPAGLDIGAEGPEEIAAAIVAEMLAVDRSRAGGFLRDRPGSIHEDRVAVAAAGGRGRGAD